MKKWRHWSVLNAERYPDAEGNVYFLRDPATRACKIGFTRRRVSTRLREMQTAQPRKLEILWAGPGLLRHETALHRMLAKSRLAHTEWYGETDLLRIILTLLPTLGIATVCEHTEANLLGFVPMDSPHMPNFWAINEGERPRPTYWPEWSGEPYAGMLP